MGSSAARRGDVSSLPAVDCDAGCVMTFRIAGIAGVLICTACASTPFVSSWRAPNAEPLQIAGAKVAAVAMMNQVASRRAAEDAIARELTARGAVGSRCTRSTRTRARATSLRRVLRLSAKGSPASGGSVQSAPSMRSSRHQRTGSPDTRCTGAATTVRMGDAMVWRGGSHEHGRVGRDARLFAASELLVWGGQSTTTNPSSVDRLVRDTAEKVTKELERQGLLAAPKR